MKNRLSPPHEHVIPLTFPRDPDPPSPVPTSIHPKKQATSDVLREPDWGVNVDMCDLVNSNFHRYGKDTVKALRLKLQKKTKPQCQYLALVALEMCMKNCGVMFHAKVIEKACLDETSKCAAARGGDARVKQKSLALIQEWALQLNLPQYRAAFDELRRKGERFPPTELTSREVTPMYTPRPGRTDIVEQRLAAMDPADAAAIRAAVQEAEAVSLFYFVWAIRMTSCFVHGSSRRGTSQRNAVTARVRQRRVRLTHRRVTPGAVRVQGRLAAQFCPAVRAQGVRSFGGG